MNEPEIGISYHALPPITRNECGWYCTLLWWRTHHGSGFSWTFFPLSLSLYFWCSCCCSDCCYCRNRMYSESEISKKNCEQIIFFFLFHSLYFIKLISLKHLCSIPGNIYAMYILSVCVCAVARSLRKGWEKKNWAHQQLIFNKVVLILLLFFPPLTIFKMRWSFACK